MVTDLLWGSMPITTRLSEVLIGVPPLLEPLLVVEPGGQRCFELGKPLLSLP
jgi:hypothetical protein